MPPYLETLLEQTVQRRAQPLLATGGLPGVLHLAQDLRFAQHQRVQAAGDAEQVAHRVVVAVHVQIVRQRGGRQAVVGRQPVGHARFRAVFDLAVDFGAVAGRQQGGFGHPGHRAQAVQRRRQLARVQGHPFAQGQRRGLVVEAKGEQGHGWLGSLAARHALSSGGLGSRGFRPIV